ncbi:site-specific DNA-methyltransferase [Geothrix terrae]|uniref:site-specific DNA-methyltransferase n=1 Tax=Geothrix terrae TaxID=2922720 RepID=UPI001FAB63E4|nr:DNA methyltransferase [Geothrix terrae]
MRPLGEISPDPRNPRKHSPRQITKIARSIETWGFNVPILVDRNGQIVAGHGRLQAAQKLGWEAVPTIMLEHLTENQAKAYRIADNRLTEISEWDDQLLAEQLKELSLVDLDFSLEVTGFEMGEIDVRIESLDLREPGEDKPDPADEVPGISAEAPVSRPGDLWLLGRHRVLCGNALEVGDLTKLMDGRKAAAVFTDPPYNVPIDGHCTGLGSVRHREFAMAAGEMSVAEFTAFLKTAMERLVACSEDGALHYVCMDWRHLPEVLDAGHQVYTELKNLCVWAKDNAGMGSFYRSQHELVLVFKHGKAPHQNHVQLGQHGRYRSNVWRYPGVNSFGRATEEGNLLALHPTVKPVALVADAILDSSRRGEIILDTFLGSGTTLMAAERVGRACFGMELDALYVDTIIRRWQKLTGDSAVLAEGGAGFEQVQAERQATDLKEVVNG